MARISRRQRRKMAVEALLRERDLDAILEMNDREPNIPSALIGLLNERDDLLRWRAIEALGVVAKAIDGDGEGAYVKDLVRRQLWTMTEESGGTAWHAAEVVAEMLSQVKWLQEDFASMVVAFGDTEPWEAGCAWAVGRLVSAGAASHLAAEVAPMTRNLGHADPAVRGHSAIALGRLGAAAARGALEALVGDEAGFERYDFEAGELRPLTVGRAAREALTSLSS